jgi:hypothetical protein
MTREEFGEALLRHGPDFKRWPMELARSAGLLVASDPVAAKMLGDFAALERTLAAAVEPPPFGAAEIGSVLVALDRAEEGWAPARRFWIAGAGASVASFVAGFVLMLMTIVQGEAIPASIIVLAFGQADIGGLL